MKGRTRNGSDRGSWGSIVATRVGPYRKTLENVRNWRDTHGIGHEPLHS